MSHPTVLAAALAAGAALGLAASGAKADPQVVSGPGALPQCFAPASADTKYFQRPAKEPPYRIALATGSSATLGESR